MTSSRLLTKTFDGFSIRFLFAKLRAKPRNKPYTNTLGQI